MKALLLLSLVASSAVFADKCDCTHFPIDPKSCARECAATRLNSAADILDEAFRNPGNGIAAELATSARCVIVVPGLNSRAFVLGEGTQHGFASCREPRGNGWTAPAAVEIEGGGYGLRIGGTESNVIILAMSSRAVEKLSQSRFALGADASAAAGPVGRNAAAPTYADLLAYSQRRGVFAGVSFEGATIKADEAVNQDIYGRDVNNAQILGGKIKPPDLATKLQDVLNRRFGTEPR
jgi:lipid-binding SYLF domain-containing protein